MRLHDAVDVDAGQVDLVGVDRADFDDAPSTSATQTLPAIAQAGLKLRAVLRNTRLPGLSAFRALTSETSALERGFQHVPVAVELAGFLAVGDHVP